MSTIQNKVMASDQKKWSLVVGSKPSVIKQIHRSPQKLPIVLRSNTSKVNVGFPELASGVYLVRGGYFKYLERQGSYDYWYNEDTPPDNGMTCRYVSTRAGEVTEKDRIMDITSITKEVIVEAMGNQRAYKIRQFIQPEGYSYHKAEWAKLHNKIIIC
jgi:hypothetical protein